MGTLVNLSTGGQRAVGIQRVYIKQTWAGGWLPLPESHCTEAAWCVSPTMPTATLVYDYGGVKNAGSPVYVIQTKLDILGWYVKVEMECEAASYMLWYGVVGHVEDHHYGIIPVNGVALASGQQTLHCYGLEKLLDGDSIADSFIDVDNEAGEWVNLPITFNEGGRPNRNDRLFVGGFANYVFEGRSIGTSATLRPTAQYWNTLYIINYLLGCKSPVESFRTRNWRIPFTLFQLNALVPVMDRPVVHQEGQTVLSILNRLLDRRRLRGFYVRVDVNVAGLGTDFVRLIPVLFNAEDIDTGIDDTDFIVGNEHPINLVYDYNENTTAIVRKSNVAKYDRIIVRGARRTSTCTMWVDTDYLQPAWTTTEEVAYETGASDEANYATWDLLEQQKRNAEVRAHESLSAVYSWFKIPDGWAGDVGDIASETLTHHVFIKDDGFAAPQYIHAVTCEPYLPLYEHVDYAGDEIADGTAEAPKHKIYRQPLVAFYMPTDLRWVAGNAIATLAEASGDADDEGTNVRWSASVRPQQDSRVIEVRVSGEQQHVIAATDFTPLDEDRDLGDYDYADQGMVCTICLQENRYAEGQYPADGTGDSANIDVRVGHIIYAGDAYRQDYVVPSTVVDIDDAGALVTTTGGYVRDDTDSLSAAARIAYEWWKQERVVITLVTTQITTYIPLGCLIETVGDWTVADNEHYETVNTVVTEVRIEWPKLEENHIAAPTMTIVTGAGELDPMTLLPREPRSRRTATAKVMAAREAKS